LAIAPGQGRAQTVHRRTELHLTAAGRGVCPEAVDDRLPGQPLAVGLEQEEEFPRRQPTPGILVAARRGVGDQYLGMTEQVGRYARQTCVPRWLRLTDSLAFGRGWDGCADRLDGLGRGRRGRRKH